MQASKLLLVRMGRQTSRILYRSNRHGPFARCSEYRPGCVDAGAPSDSNLQTQLTKEAEGRNHVNVRGGHFHHDSERHSAEERSYLQPLLEPDV